MKILSLFSFSRKISRQVVSGEKRLSGRQVSVFRVSCDYVTCISFCWAGPVYLIQIACMLPEREKWAGSVISSRCSEVRGINRAGFFSPPNCHVTPRSTTFSDLNKPFPSLSTSAAPQYLFNIDLYTQLKPWNFFSYHVRPFSGRKTSKMLLDFTWLTLGT